jgi:dienelactone hydrolase
MRILPVALLASALLAAPAAAEDACLTGAANLADQRALVALRAATEAACPCGAFTRRHAYQRCAREALRAAVAAGELRPACVRVARSTNRGAVCGSDRVACGRWHPGAAARSCRVKRPERCRDRAGYEEHACAAETHCADVVDWTAATCVDPRAPGPFAPGVRVVTMTKPSVVNPAQTRVLDTLVWYPAPPGSGPLSPTYAAVQDAPLDLAGGPYPLLVFSHGSCGYAYQSTFLTPLLASHGFVVAAPPHPGNTIFEFPACGSAANVAASAAERPQDVLHVLDEMLAANLDPGSPFFGSIDPARLGMSGHSFGGFTTYLAVALDARFTVAMPLAAAVPGTPVLTIPSLTMLGQIDTVVSNTAIRNAYAAALPPKHLVEIRDAGHYAFSNLCFAGPDCAPPATLTQAEAHAQVLRWVLPFLKVHLAGDAGFAPFLAPPPGPGVVHEAVP